MPTINDMELAKAADKTVREILRVREGESLLITIDSNALSPAMASTSRRTARSSIRNSWTSPTRADTSETVGLRLMSLGRGARGSSPDAYELPPGAGFSPRSACCRCRCCSANWLLRRW